LIQETQNPTESTPVTGGTRCPRSVGWPGSQAVMVVMKGWHLTCRFTDSDTLLVWCFGRTLLVQPSQWWELQWIPFYPSITQPSDGFCFFHIKSLKVNGSNSNTETNSVFLPYLYLFYLYLCKYFMNVFFLRSSTGKLEATFKLSQFPLQETLMSSDLTQYLCFIQSHLFSKNK
jgi:hypothetical protein